MLVGRKDDGRKDSESCFATKIPLTFNMSMLVCIMLRYCVGGERKKEFGGKSGGVLFELDEREKGGKITKLVTKIEG